MDKKTPVAKIMTRKVVVANADNHTFSQVRRLFLKYNVHHLPVTDKNDHVLGIISSQDLLRGYEELARRIKVIDDRVLDHELKLKDIMTKNPMIISPKETILKVAEIFGQNKFHALPVVEDGRLVGLVTSNDLIKVILD
ncbi:MAG: hypothetical protein KatS3mg031_0866 [Chitinophagales bacterium]|nr:MAG: hypothetical protein KatS3mg031_0866 [Chitinophagales bacterium]